MALQHPKTSPLQMSVLPRLQGDGMDSEALRQQEFSPQTQRKMSSRRNLNASHKAATVSRPQQPKFIPKEPVKGAVKAVVTEISPVKGEQKTPRRRSAPLPTQYSSTPMNTGRVLPPMAQPVSPIMVKNISKSASAGQNQMFQPSQMIPYTFAKSNAGTNYNPILQSPVVQVMNGNNIQNPADNVNSSKSPVSIKNYHNASPQNPPQAKNQMDASRPTNVQPTMTANKTVSPTNRETVLTVQVPVYQGPGHLHPKTYEMLRNNQLQLKQGDGVQLNSDKGTSSQSGNVATDQVGTVKCSENAMPALASEEREVEGQDKTHVDTLNESIKQLQEKLNVQSKVNEDLKKMLVASMGDDLHYRVEALVRTKAHLAQEVGGYSEKLCQGYEEVDKLAIQADMWHTKYRAAKVLVEDLTLQRGALHQQSEQVRYALQMLIQERHSVKDFMVTAHKHLHQLKDALGPHMRGVKVTSQPASVLDLAKVISQLADGLRGSLLGAIPAQPTSLDSSTLVSPAEQIAYQVLFQSSSPSHEDHILPSTGSVAPLPHPLATPLAERYPRFHPHVRYHNLTVNCCRKCKGDIHVV